MILKIEYLALFNVFLFFLACKEYKPNDVLPKKDVDVTIDLNLPAYQNLLIPGGVAYTPISAEYGLQGIVVVNFNNTNFKAYDRASPHIRLGSCAPMNYKNFQLICPCDSTAFNLIDGGTSKSVEFQAREYFVESVGNILKINNY